VSNRRLMIAGFLVPWAILPSVAAAQNSYGPDGMQMFAEVFVDGGGVSVGSASGLIETVRLRPAKNMRIQLPREALGRKVGTLSIGPRSEPLRAPMKKARVNTLLDGGGVRVRLVLYGERPGLRINFLSRPVESFELKFEGLGGTVVVGNRCPTENRVNAAVTRTQGDPVYLQAGSTCY
jgi:hypothetical protein